MTEPVTENAAGETPETCRPLTGHTVVLSGTYETLTRGEAEEHVERLGGTLGANVTAKTTLLVAGKGSGSKTRAAQAKSIPIMTGETYEALVKAPHRTELVRDAVEAAPNPAEETETKAPEGTPRRETDRAHDSYYSTGNPGGVWTVWMKCFCKEWSHTGHSVTAAHEAHTEHRTELGLGPLPRR